MYRKHLKDKMEEQLVTKVTELPVVNSALEQVSSLYAKTKDYNRWTRLTCQLAESSAFIAMTTSRPVMGLLEPQLNAVNAYGVQKLDAMTEAYPIITKPTEEVVQETKAYMDKTVKPIVKPTYDRIVAPVNYTIDTYNSVKGYGVEKVNAVKTGVTNKIDDVKSGAKKSVDLVKDFGCNTVKEVMETPYGKALQGRIDSSISTAEQMVDTFLPAEESQTEEETKPLSEETTVSCDSNPVMRVGTLGNKVRRRMYAKAMKEVTQLQRRSKEALDKLNFSVDLMKYAREHFDSAKTTVSENYEASKEKVAGLWEEVNREEDEGEIENKENVKDMTVERRTIMAARHLTLRLKRSMSSLSSMTSRVLPVGLKARVDEMKQFSEEWFKAFTEAHSVLDIPVIVLDQVKGQISRVEQLLSDVTDYILETPALNWMGLKRKKGEEIEMKSMNVDKDADMSVDEVDEEDEDDDEDDDDDDDDDDDVVSGEDNEVGGEQYYSQ